jgi:hypothetical protein
MSGLDRPPMRRYRSLVRKNCMRPPGRTRPIIFGFILAIGITLTLPHFVFGGAARSFGGSGRFKAPGIHRQQSFLRPFHDLGRSGRFHRHPFTGFGFGGGVAVSEQPVVIIQQFQPVPITEPREPAPNRVYVQPRWVDGGHGVEVLQPGYWTDAKQATGR